MEIRENQVEKYQKAIESINESRLKMLKEKTYQEPCYDQKQQGIMRLWAVHGNRVLFRWNEARRKLTHSSTMPLPMKRAASAHVTSFRREKGDQNQQVGGLSQPPHTMQAIERVQD